MILYSPAEKDRTWHYRLLSTIETGFSAESLTDGPYENRSLSFDATARYYHTAYQHVTRVSSFVLNNRPKIPDLLGLAQLNTQFCRQALHVNGIRLVEPEASGVEDSTVRLALRRDPLLIGADVFASGMVKVVVDLPAQLTVRGSGAEARRDLPDLRGHASAISHLIKVGGEGDVGQLETAYVVELL